MGKQRNKAKTKGERSESVNATNWDARAQELFKAGLIGATALGTDVPYADSKDRR